MEEEWMAIIGYENLYEISNKGQVRSLRNKIIMKQLTHYKGYKYLYLGNHGRKKFFVHRLVACAFIPNKDNKEIVNHIDENKSNNIITNLEWMTVGENTRYYWEQRGIEINNDDIPF